MKKLLVSCLMCMFACNMAMAESVIFMGMLIDESKVDYSDEYFTRGTISYDSDNNVLTLNNVDITSDRRSAVIRFDSDIKDFTIKLVGENHIAYGGPFILHSGNANFTIEGPGSLDFSTSDIRGIELGGFDKEGECFLTIKDCDIKIKAEKQSIFGSQGDSQEKGVLTVIFDNAHAELYGYSVTTWMTFYDSAITTIKDIILKNCTYTEPAAPYVGTYFGSNCLLEDVDGEARGVQKLVITPGSAGIRQQTIKNNPTTIKRVNNRNQLEIEKNGHIYNETGNKIK